jgi:hypothetical protein
LILVRKDERKRQPGTAKTDWRTLLKRVLNKYDVMVRMDQTGSEEVQRQALVNAIINIRVPLKFFEGLSHLTELTVQQNSKIIDTLGT